MDESHRDEILNPVVHVFDMVQTLAYQVGMSTHHNAAPVQSDGCGIAEHGEQ